VSTNSCLTRFMLVTDYISRRSPSSWQGEGVADYSGVVGGYIYVSEASYIVRKFEFTKDCSKKNTISLLVQVLDHILFILRLMLFQASIQGSQQ
jgi:hypothetical protein